MHSEVKAIRDGKMNLRDGFCKPDKYGRCYLHNVHIGQHTGEFKFVFIRHTSYIIIDSIVRNYISQALVPIFNMMRDESEPFF